MQNGEFIKMEFNGREVEAPEGDTVLRAAELNDVYIPTLCSHKDLSPFGGCRLCIVEIDGIRGYPLACNTSASDGMKVLTDTAAIQDIRQEVLQLILSEHPSSCLICEESEECKKFQGTVRKSGVASGCRFCPNDQQCELQDLTERFGITDIGYPILYKGYEAERLDPFFDRDYNICILCGRCVRMCQEMRGTGVLAFNYRGQKTRVDTAYGRSHIESGCEFCGACISVCPTGALAEKASKWDGIPDGSIVTTCPYCAIGCQMEFWHKNRMFSMATPVHDPEVNDGQACVKGRFCIGEVSHHFDRARKPFAKEDSLWKEKTWDEAIEIAASKLRDLEEGDFAMLISPDCTNESLYVAQKFTRLAMGTNSIDTTARYSLTGGFGIWSKMFSRQISILDIKNSSNILAVGLDTRFNFSIIGVEIRKAMQKGARLVTIGPRESNLARYAETWIQPMPGLEGTILKALASGKKKDLKKAAKDCEIDQASLLEASELIESGDDLTVILGPSLFRYNALADLVDAIQILADRDNVNIIPLYIGANTRGAMEMGVFADLLPGPVVPEESTLKTLEDRWNSKPPTDEGIKIDAIVSGASKPKVLYLVGTQPVLDRPECDFLIVQDIFEPDFECDLYLPASSFLESEGTIVNVEGRVQHMSRIEELPDSVMYGRTRPDWWIFSEIAKILGVSGFDFDSNEDVMMDISSVVSGFPHAGKPNRSKRSFTAPLDLPNPADMAAAPVRGNFLLVIRPMDYTHRGVSITTKVEGLQILKPDQGFYIGQEDADKLGIEDGDIIVVKAGTEEGKAPARIEPELPKGVVYLYVPDTLGGQVSGRDLEPLYRLKENPVRVEVSKDGV